MKDQIQKIIQAYHAKGEFEGVALAAQNGKAIYKGAVGLANRAWNIPHRLDTKFRISSITKQFTAMLIMQLVEAGKLRLDAPISDYLPDYRKDTGGKIRLRDLLTSASGLPTFDDMNFWQKEEEKLASPGFVARNYLAGDLTFEPGSRFNYNNADFILLGAIIEKATGKTYEEVLRQQILTPARMRQTGMVRQEAIIENLANGYVKTNGGIQNEPYFRIQNFSAAGAMYSTLDDMLLWDNALLTHALLTPKRQEEMFTASEKLGFVALGSWVYTLKLADGRPHRLIERQGNIGGFCSLNIIAPEDHICVVLLSNTETQALFRTYAGEGPGYEILNVLTASDGK